MFLVQFVCCFHRGVPSTLSPSEFYDPKIHPETIEVRKRGVTILTFFFFPNFIFIFSRFQTGGSILAGKLALERGWSINLGGGFHHCSARKGGGFCIYADITLLIHFLFKYYSDRVKKIMIVDLDAHQGNGHERDFKNNPNIYILDVFNKNIYPNDAEAKKSIRRKVELDFYTHDNEYLPLVKG